MQGLVYPSLPQGAVKTALCGDNADAVKLLSGHGIDVITIDSNKRLPKPVCSHADMLCCHLSEDIIFSYSKSAEDAVQKSGIECIVPDIVPQPIYPYDIALNCAVVGKYLVANLNYACGELLAAAQKLGLELINVKQDYARCSIAIIDENSVITADKNIAAKLREKGIDVLLIRPGHINLPGYGYGFIGGTCGKIAEDKILFFGNPDLHPDGSSIRRFIESKGISVIAADGQLFDFGGFMPIKVTY
ncbi:MAG: hypothetical protein J6L81_03825 [Clostridia bacterium]|nr:hypothetical protein [Clostridia bacterium]